MTDAATHRRHRDDPRAHRLAVTLGQPRSHLEPDGLRRTLLLERVAIDARGTLDVADHQIEVAVSLEIGGDQAAAHVEVSAERPAPRSGVGEAAGLLLDQEQVRLRVLVPEPVRSTAERFRPRLDRAIGDRDVEVGVEIGIEQRDAEAGERKARQADSRSRRDVLEAERASILVERVGFLDQVSDQDVEVSVVSEVGGRETHSGLADAVAVVGGAQQHRIVAKRPVTLIDPEVVGVGVVRDVDIDPAVVVEVGGDHTQTAQLHASDTGGSGAILERSIAAVAIEQVVHAGELLRTAVVEAPAFERALAARIELDVAGHEEIEPTVAVVVEEGRRRGPGLVAQPRTRGVVAESAAAGVAVELVAAPGGHEYVEVAVVVDIAARAPHAVSRVAEPGRIGVVDVATVRLAPQETVSARPCRRSCRGPEISSVDEVQVQIVVTVGIEHAEPAAHDRGHGIGALGAGRVHEVDAELPGHLCEHWRGNTLRTAPSARYARRGLRRVGGTARATAESRCKSDCRRDYEHQHGAGPPALFVHASP